MPQFEILGDAPDIRADDVLEMADEIARYDIVTFERIGPARLHMRVVKPREYSAFRGTMYQIDRGQVEGACRLRQVWMKFWTPNEH